MVSSRRNISRDSESGFVLLAVICLMVLLLISLAIAAPKVAQSIQRDKDLETIHRGEQYREAIKNYYTKFGAYPTSIDQLLDTNNMRFLRKRYADPLTGKDDWKPIFYGHAHVHPLGFFGKPLSAIGGIAAASVGITAGSSGMYAITPTSTDANGDSTSDDNDGFGSTPDNSTTQSAFGTSSGGMGGDGIFSGGQSGFGNSSGSTGLGSSGPGSTGLGSSGFGSSSSSSSPFGASGGTSATTFGANGTGPIVGFTLPVNKPSLVDYMEQTRYNKWEFNYDPAADQLQQAVSLLGGGANTAINGANGDAATNGANGTSTTDNGFGTSTSGAGSSGSIFGSGSDNSNGSSGTSSTPQPNSPNSPNSPDTPQ